MRLENDIVSVEESFPSFLAQATVWKCCDATSWFDHETRESLANIFFAVDILKWNGDVLLYSKIKKIVLIFLKINV